MRACGLRTNAGGVEVSEGVEAGIEAENLRDVLVGQLERCDGATLQQGELFSRGKKGDGHRGVKGHYNFGKVQTVLSRAEAAFSWTEILGRREPNRERIRVAGLAGRRVLVTGARGFIGSGIVREAVPGAAVPSR